MNILSRVDNADIAKQCLTQSDITEAQREQVHRLWDDLAEVSPADVDAAARRVIDAISGWIGADHAAWLGTVRFITGAPAKRDALSGWRTTAIVFHPPPTAAEAAAAREILRGPQAIAPGLTSIATAKLAGSFRVHRMRDGFVDFKAFSKTDHYRSYYQGLSVHDRIWVGAPVNQDTEIFFIFDRRRSAEQFLPADAALAGYALRGLKWFFRLLLCGHGLMSTQSPLTATERRVVRLLLTTQSEKEIAEQLNQSPHTTHGHIKEIYRKFGVSGRAALTACWLTPI